jgi:type II secretory pathway component PulF
MAEFEYKARDSEGRFVTGRIVADDSDQAREQLAAQRLILDPQGLTALGEGAADENTELPKPGRLSGRETAELVETVVELTAADLPLSAGLRAAAEEVPHRRVAEAMRRMAMGIDSGQSLDVALGSSADGIPNHLRGLILAGLRTGRVAHVLEELVAMDQEQIELRRRVTTALAYPTLLFFVVIGFFLLAERFIARPFANLFTEFGVDLPAITEMLIAMMNWLDKSGMWTVSIVLFIVVPAFIILLLVPKPAGLQRACYLIPVLGPLWRWQSLVDFSRLMHLMLDRQIPLAEALRLTADGLRWADMAVVSRVCAKDVGAGMSLPEAMARHPEFPPSMRPVIDSGLRANEMPEAFSAAAEMYRRRAGVDATLWEAILPPLILVFVSGGVGFLVLALFLPMVKLISSLS